MRLIFRLLRWLVAGLAIAFIAFAIFVRTAGDDPAEWHLDPETARETGAQNDFIVAPSGEGVDMASPVFPMAPDALAARFAEVALAAPNTTLLSENGGYATFVQRTAVIAYPDYISVKAVAVEGGSALFIYSRSRFGQSDFGVNETRISAWLNEL
ncbi:MAG: DUF1499 domain-containing protein [Pseudomonadota bacterium]